VYAVFHGNLGARLDASRAAVGAANANLAAAQQSTSYRTNSQASGYATSYGGMATGSAYGTSTTSPDFASSFVSALAAGQAASAAQQANALVESANADASFLAQNSFGPISLEPDTAAEGFIYFSAPSQLPITILGKISGHHFSFKMDDPAAFLPIRSIKN
jgi:hypothetical protein